MQVKSCPTTDLPPGISGDLVEKEPEEEVEQSCVEEQRSSVDSSITEGELVSLSTWRRHDEADSNFCDIDSPSSCVDCVYVDLTKNPERYTGYSGHASRRVWASIYEENCFSPSKATTKPPAFSSAFGQSQLGEMCLEKRAFYRVVSGLHASITIHLAANYPLDKKDPAAAFLPGSGEAWGPNMELFHQRFDPELTEGQGPYWLKNLYFVYLLELRALAKASDYLSRQTYFTGRQEEDKETVIAVKELLNLISSFKDHFDETSMFTGGLQANVNITCTLMDIELFFLAQELKQEFQGHFRNISRVMDCVGCDKCKLWGKLQVNHCFCAWTCFPRVEFNTFNEFFYPEQF